MTNFKEIYSFAKVTIIDYKIDALIKTNYDAFLEYMRSLLTIGIPEFKGCLVDLSYTTETTTINNDDGTTTDVVDYYFINDLTMSEKSVLAKIVVKKWWETKIQETTVFQPKLSFREFKQVGTEQNLKQKSEYKDKLEEDISREITEYQLENLSKLPYFGGD